MLWQLPASVRSLAAISAPPCWAQTCRRYSVGGAPREPLSILFCGSDAFSIKSLDAINEAREAVPGLIRSIDVVHRRAKFTGRRLKTLREGMFVYKQIGTNRNNTGYNSHSMYSFVECGVANTQRTQQSQYMTSQPRSTSQLTPSTPSQTGTRPLPYPL
jgi:hypothetical protein